MKNVLHLKETTRRYDGTDVDRSSDTREKRDFIAWPPPGYVPKEEVYPRWSFELGFGADVSDATVSMVYDGDPVSVTIIYSDEYAIVWETPAYAYTRTESTVRNNCATVTISGVTRTVNFVEEELMDPFEYAVCVVFPD